MGGYNAAFLEELMADPYIAAKLGGVVPGIVPGGMTGAKPAPAASVPESDLYNQAPESELGAERPVPGAVPPSATMAPGKKPGFLSRLKEVMPRAIAAGIAGGATPNVAGGSGVDVLRAMQAGQNELERRDLMNYGLRRQGSLDELNRRHTEAQIGQAESASEENRARAAQYRAVAAGKDAVNPAHDLYNRYLAETDPEKKEALFKMYLQAIGHSPKIPGSDETKAGLLTEYLNPNTTPERKQAIEKALMLGHPASTPRPIIARPGDTILGPDNKPVFTAPPAAQRPTIVPQGGTILGPDGKPVFTAPNRPTGQAGQAQFRIVEQKKADRMSRADRDARNEIEKLQTATDITAEEMPNRIQAIWTQADEEKQAAQDAYENEIAALTGQQPPHVELPKTNVRKRSPAPASAPAPATSPAAVSPEAQALVGKTVRLKDGRVVKVKAVNPDGTFIPE